MLASTTSRELTEWQAFYELEPFGEERADLRAGIVASTIAEVNRDRKKNKKAYTPQDFMPKFGRGGDAGAADEEKSVEQLKAKWAAVVAAFGGGKKGGGGNKGIGE